MAIKKEEIVGTKIINEIQSTNLKKTTYEIWFTPWRPWTKSEQSDNENEFEGITITALNWTEINKKVNRRAFEIKIVKTFGW